MAPPNLDDDSERSACFPVYVDRQDFNIEAWLPYGVTTDHVCSAMNEFIDFIGFINQQLATRQIPRLECMLMPANFSSIVGEFIATSIPKYCDSVVRNRYHNGHPDLLPAGMFPRDACQYGHTGIEIKASRYLRGWQGHNAEESFLTVFCFEASRPSDEVNGIAPKPFRFLLVCGAQLERDDWIFSGRSETSRRTITASVNDRGYAKMMTNWIYRAPEIL
jgi:hypothetical protein